MYICIQIYFLIAIRVYTYTITNENIRELRPVLTHTKQRNPKLNFMANMSKRKPWIRLNCMKSLKHHEGKFNDDAEMVNFSLYAIE